MSTSGRRDEDDMRGWTEEKEEKRRTREEQDETEERKLALDCSVAVFSRANADKSEVQDADKAIGSLSEGKCPGCREAN